MKITDRAKRKLLSFGVREFAIVEKEDGYEIEVGEREGKSLKVEEFTVYYDEKLEERVLRAVLDFDCFFFIRFE
ncbi:hypothetical protein Ferp_1349 [Ferroglobus placidus DSM 10642]|uniref:Uncharacterized protein n=1 Tax=Ferroglobus placidus (strain DSM 10642 / AEDII12DO) TaxID=589924 RepID=D3RYD7_FERPA|nr:hypothetical protein [Ferroglobus placidus]ADC65500.1 hypothetical protein Ferp_1349 [Ferroglobus placidus DSM 10642]